jgi:hypothetical protein
MTFEDQYDAIDTIWPVKRRPEVRAIERQRMKELSLTDEGFEKFKNKIEILLEDTKDTRSLPSLSSLFSPVEKQAARTVVSVSVEEPETPEVNRAEELFATLFAAWPQYDIPQNEKTAKDAFLSVARRRPLEDIEKACLLYVKEMSDPAKAAVRVLGIKRFVSEDVLQEWIDRAENESSPYDRSLFDAVYSWYPEFPNKSVPATVSDSLSFYKRFIAGEDAVKFYAAVKAYRDERRSEVKAMENMGDLDGDRFTKRFISFIRVWKFQKCRDDLSFILEVPFLNALKKRGIKYDLVYPGEHFLSALKWFCDGDENRKVSDVLTDMLERICKCLTSGQNHVNLIEKLSPDYSVVSEAIAGALELAKRHNHFIGVNQPNKETK